MADPKDSGSKVSLAGIALILLLVSGAVLVVAQVWGGVFSTEMFTKILITYGIVIATVVIVFLVWREFGEENKMKKDKYMD